MKIISKFHDYYDSVQKFGHDDQHFYKRETVDLGKIRGTHLNDLQRMCGYTRTTKKHRYEYMFVGFCGKLYPVVKVEDSFQYYRPVGHVSFQHYFYNIESLEEFIYANDNKKDIDEYLKSSRYSNNLTQKYVKEFYELSFDVRQYSIDNALPIFKVHNVGRGDVIEKDCSLKELEFFKLFDSYSAYQELEMFICGVLINDENPMVKIDDVTRLEKHGFDKKSSFRHRS